MAQRNGMNPTPKVPGGQQYWPQADGTLTVNNINQAVSTDMNIDSRTPPALRGRPPEDISAAKLRAKAKADRTGKATVRRFGTVPRDI